MSSRYYATTTEQDAIPDDERTSLDFVSPGPQTVKSSYNNRLVEQQLERV